MRRKGTRKRQWSLHEGAAAAACLVPQELLGCQDQSGTMRLCRTTVRRWSLMQRGRRARGGGRPQWATQGLAACAGRPGGTTQNQAHLVGAKRTSEQHPTCMIRRPITVMRRRRRTWTRRVPSLAAWAGSCNLCMRQAMMWMRACKIGSTHIVGPLAAVSPGSTRTGCTNGRPGGGSGSCPKTPMMPNWCGAADRELRSETCG
mmetsp:Transcript_36325/g.80839  ORF Transcript_36325/g.80839 Transcript_36325/m.80839 type:complete len:203 (+) Transcript_36325:691-1299(+)